MEKFIPSLDKNALISNSVWEDSQIKLSLRAKKTLFALIQSVDPLGELFGEEMVFELKHFFKLLDIEKSGERFNIVRDCFSEIASNPLIRVNENSTKGEIYSWIKYLKWDNESGEVRLRFTEDIRPFLHQMKGYIKLKGKYIAHLSSNYAMSLYPLMKVVQGKYKGRHIYTIEELMIITGTDNKKKNKAYHDKRLGLGNFKKKVLGVRQIQKSTKYEVILPYKEKSSSNYITPPLAEINIKTDIVVDCQPIKRGRKVIAFEFFVKKSSPLADKIALAEKMKVGVDLHTEAMLELAKANNHENVEDYAKSMGYEVLNGKGYKVGDQLTLDMPKPLERWVKDPTNKMNYFSLHKWRKDELLLHIPEDLFWKISFKLELQMKDRKIKMEFLEVEASKLFGVHTKAQLQVNIDDNWEALRKLNS